MLTRDEILSIAESEGCYLSECDYLPGAGMHAFADGRITDLLQKVAAAAAAAEREACAEICDSHAKHFNRNELQWEWSDEAAACADEIRARGEVQQ